MVEGSGERANKYIGRERERETMMMGFLSLSLSPEG